MVNILLYEINSKINPKKSISKNNQVIDDIEKLRFEDITNQACCGAFNFSTKYNIVYLYDYMNDNIAKQFLKEYGGILHNFTSTTTSFITYFDKEMLSDWDNLSTDFDNYGVDSKYFEIMEVIEQWKDNYGIVSLPSILVLNKENANDYFSIQVGNLNKNELWQISRKIYLAISTYYNDFDKIEGSILNTELLNKDNLLCNQYEFSELIDKLIKNKIPGQLRGFTTQIHLCEALGLCDNTFRDYRNNLKFKQDHLIVIALAYGLNINELNKMFEINHCPKLGSSARDMMICLEFKEKEPDLYQLNERLIKNGFKQLFNSRGY